MLCSDRILGIESNFSLICIAEFSVLVTACVIMLRQCVSVNILLWCIFVNILRRSVHGIFSPFDFSDIPSW